MKSAATTAATPRSRLPRPPGHVSDRWLLWPPLATTAVVAGLTLLCGLPGTVSFLLIPASLLGYLVATIALLGAGAVQAAKRRPRRAISVLVALVAPFLLWVPIKWAADCLHVGLTVGFGVGQLGSPSKHDGSRFAAYDWSTGLAGGPATFLIYDESDEIALPLAIHRQPANSEDGFGEDCAGKVKHLLAHYYVCTF
jgi:hypothetical protein